MSVLNTSALSRLPASVQGMAWMFLTTIMIVSMHSFIRELTTQLHPFEVAFFRNFFGLPIAIILIMRYGWGLFRTERVQTHVIRSIGHVLAMSMFFVGIVTTPLATANALTFGAPLFAAALAVLFLGEMFRWRRWAALLFGFAGVLVVLRPGFVALETGPLLILISTFIWGIVLVIIKSLGRKDATPTIIVYMVAIMTPLSLIPALFVWTWPTLEQYGLMLIMGLVGTAGHLTLTQALKLADTAVIMPIDFFKLVWASLFGFVLFAEVPDTFTWIGGTMIFVGATYLAIRERNDARAARVDEPLNPGS
ncbi:MAG: EamA family transporter [Alphaproteobacteria bacterium]|nr:EamA family transporter [Alphaproteobacteria bacterium]